MTIEVTGCHDCPLTEDEIKERELLIELKKSRTRWFSQQEFDRLQYLSNKLFENAGSPHTAKTRNDNN
jgi:hypothetical protein